MRETKLVSLIQQSVCVCEGKAAGEGKYQKCVNVPMDMKGKKAGVRNEISHRVSRRVYGSRGMRLLFHQELNHHHQEME